MKIRCWLYDFCEAEKRSGVLQCCARQKLLRGAAWAKAWTHDWRAGIRSTTLCTLDPVQPGEAITDPGNAVYWVVFKMMMRMLRGHLPVDSYELQHLFSIENPVVAGDFWEYFLAVANSYVGISENAEWRVFFQTTMSDVAYFRYLLECIIANVKYLWDSMHQFSDVYSYNRHLFLIEFDRLYEQMLLYSRQQDQLQEWLVVYTCPSFFTAGKCRIPEPVRRYIGSFLIGWHHRKPTL